MFSRPISLFQDLNLMDNPINSHRRKLLPDNLCLLACPYISYGYCVNHSRLRCRMRPFRRIIICDIKVCISPDTWDLPTARVLPYRYVSVNIWLVFLIRLVIKLHRSISAIIACYPQPCPSKRIKVKPTLLINIQPDIQTKSVPCRCDDLLRCTDALCQLLNSQRSQRIFVLHISPYHCAGQPVRPQ